MKTLNSNDLAGIEALIRSGHQARARLSLAKITPAQLRRDDFARFANLLARAGLYQKGLRLLNPLVRNPRLRDGATPGEKLEYAYLLIKIGALQEARSILAEINPSDLPDALLYTTFALTPEWRYEETIAPLRRYLDLLGSNRPYQSLIARVNLTAALIFCRNTDQANALLREAKAAAAELKADFLLGSLNELAAQMALGQDNFSAAESHLNEAARLLQTSVTAENLYVQKWRLVLEFLKSPRPADLFGRMQDLRAVALAKREWEVARDVDFQILKRVRNVETFDYLYCGSPIEAFRLRLETSLTGFAQPADTFAWAGRPGPVPPELYDLHAGTDRRGRKIVEVGQAPHRLWLLLCRDFYRPQSLAQISAWLYPGELYHPVHTPVKVHQIVTRLRRHLEQARVPIDIAGFGGSLRLEFKGPCALIKNWRLDSVQPGKTELETEPALKKLSDRQFRARDLARVMDISLSSAVRRINRLLTEGKLIREGTGKKTAYRIKTAA